MLPPPNTNSTALAHKVATMLKQHEQSQQPAIALGPKINRLDSESLVKGTFGGLKRFVRAHANILTWVEGETSDASLVRVTAQRKGVVSKTDDWTMVATLKGKSGSGSEGTSPQRGPTSTGFPVRADLWGQGHPALFQKNEHNRKVLTDTFAQFGPVLFIDLWTETPRPWCKVVYEHERDGSKAIGHKFTSPKFGGATVVAAEWEDRRRESGGRPPGMCL